MQNRPADALVEYERSMKVDPNRFNGLYGAGKAAELVGECDKAHKYYAQVLRNCTGEQSGRPELTHANEQIRATYHH